MFKKLGITVAAVAASVVGLHMSGLTSYPATAWGRISKSMKSSVPIEFEIERLHHEVAKLVPDMKEHFNTLAQEMVAVENLQREVASTRVNLQKQKDNILTMTKDLESGATYIKYDGTRYPASRIKEKLTRDFAAYQICESELKTKEQLLEARQHALDTAREQLAQLKSQKQELEIQVAQLEAELKTVRLAQTRNKVHLDDSQLARCKQTLAEIRDRLRVEQHASMLEGQYTNDAIPVSKKEVSNDELIKQVRNHLTETPEGSVAEKN